MDKPTFIYRELKKYTQRTNEPRMMVGNLQCKEWIFELEI